MLKVSSLVYKMYLWYALVFQAKRIRNLLVLLSHLNFCTNCHVSKLYKPGPTMQVLRVLWFVFKYLLVLVNKYTIVLSKVTLIVLSFYSFIQPKHSKIRIHPIYKGIYHIVSTNVNTNSNSGLIAMLPRRLSHVEDIIFLGGLEETLLNYKYDSR